MRPALLGYLAVALFVTSARGDFLVDTIMYNGGSGNPAVQFDPISGSLQPRSYGLGYNTSGITYSGTSSVLHPGTYNSSGFSFGLPVAASSDGLGGFLYGAGGVLMVAATSGVTSGPAYQSSFTSGQVRLISGTVSGGEYQATFTTAAATPDASLAAFFGLGNAKLSVELNVRFSTTGSSNALDYLTPGSNSSLQFNIVPQSVPEPASLMLVASRLGLAGWRLRRRCPAGKLTLD